METTGTKIVETKSFSFEELDRPKRVESIVTGRKHLMNYYYGINESRYGEPPTH